MVFYQFYTHLVDLFLPVLPAQYYGIEFAVFFVWAVFVFFRVSYKLPAAYNRDNILLAFYKGEGGSILMELFSLFGTPVKSLCVVAGESTLMLKRSKDNFVYANNADLIVGNPDYIIVDTGKKWTPEFKKQMAMNRMQPTEKWGLRIMCIESITNLLESIGEVWKPNSICDRVPSIYLFRRLNGNRS